MASLLDDEDAILKALRVVYTQCVFVCRKQLVVVLQGSEVLKGEEDVQATL